MAETNPVATRPKPPNATANATESNAPAANLTGSKPAETTMPVKKSVTLLLNVQEKDVPVVITDLASFRLELTQRVDFGSAATFADWLNKNYGSEAPNAPAGTPKIALPPITDVPPQLRTLYLVFTNAHVWLDALLIDKKTQEFKFGVSIDFTQTPVENLPDPTKVDAAVKAAIDDKAQETKKPKADLEKEDKALVEAAKSEVAKAQTDITTAGGWEILPGIKIKGIGVMFERPPAEAKADSKAEPVQ